MWKKSTRNIWNVFLKTEVFFFYHNWFLNSILHNLTTTYMKVTVYTKETFRGYLDEMRLYPVISLNGLRISSWNTISHENYKYLVKFSELILGGLKYKHLKNISKHNLQSTTTILDTLN